MLKVKFVPLILALLLCFSAGVLGSVFTTSAIPNWYATLQKPFFNPPNWVFGPVWTLLYIMMGIALYIVWETKVKKGVLKKNALVYFYTQLILNAVWSIVFFGLHAPLIALLVILLLWLSIFITIKQFYPISKTAGNMLIPYLAWVSFAAILNVFIVILNR